MNKLPIPSSVLNAHSAVLGKTGAGKSSLIRCIVEDLISRDKRVCVIDPKGDWYGLKLNADGKPAGNNVITFGNFVDDDATDVPINEHSGKAIAELISKGNRPCVIGFRGWMPGRMTKFWIDFALQPFSIPSPANFISFWTRLIIWSKTDWILVPFFIMGILVLTLLILSQLYYK